jgi:hypothetical protein
VTITANCQGSRPIAAMAARPSCAVSNSKTLAAAELGKHFPRTDIVVYNERFLLGSCTDAISVAPLLYSRFWQYVDQSANQLETS